MPLLKDKKLLLGISGGVDSVVLCHLLDLSGMEFGLAHCNFQLRGKDSDSDERFVQELAKKYGRPLHLKRFDTESIARETKGSVQMVARDLRYAWFRELLSEEGYDFLLTAHHLDDSLETFLINLSRGTGIDGLLGVPQQKDETVRPLLPFTKKQILAYALDWNLSWREDQSNLESKYLRNKIRNEIVPVLLQLHPDFMTSFATTIGNLKAARQILADRLALVTREISEPSVDHGPNCQRFEIAKIRELTPAAAYVYEIFRPYGFSQWQDILTLLDAQSGKQLLSSSHRLIKHGEHLLLARLSDQPDLDTSYRIEAGQSELSGCGISLHFRGINRSSMEAETTVKQVSEKALFDADLLQFPLTVRKWQKGDFFYPKGMTGRKKLSDFFTDEKFSVLQKENIWLLCSGDSVVWLIGKRTDERFKVTEKTKHILEVATEL